MKILDTQDTKMLPFSLFFLKISSYSYSITFTDLLYSRIYSSIFSNGKHVHTLIRSASNIVIYNDFLLQFLLYY